MSTRLLLFGSFKVHFACATYQWSEGDKAPGRMSTSTTLDQVAKFKESRISARELYQCWDSLINNYGHRSVTFDKDRLSAIAGLARIVGEALQDQYLAGLWRRDLLEGLMWYSSSPTMARGLDVYLQNVRQRNYVAPSWSWAACQDVGSTRSSDQYLRRITHRATVVDVGVETDSENPYGQISGGFLRIRGKLAAMPTWVMNNKRSNCGEWSNSWFQDLGPGLDCLYIVTDWIHNDRKAGLDLLVVMLLFEIEPDGETRAPDVRALLLHPADGPKRYYRVGTIRSKGPRGYELMANWFKDSQEDTICII
ncbi:hypothetical protein GT037_005485 [Alternaria burnsii]|uniref:Heterokaryon incompatibility domain-containing protein n=1 Tax=Alternaria burnsii TaxID=1187904 RepID=A0A8H7EF39_9PLEO|nr:uncharacterized protein GT037_005485 [Alternaria burnsii]KAF7675980.1 hypothetical protein GT037_005485 [Alternaria burnsii]